MRPNRVDSATVYDVEALGAWLSLTVPIMRQRLEAGGLARDYGAIVRHRREQLAARAAADLRWAVVSAKSVGRKEVTACAT